MEKSKRKWLLVAVVGIFFLSLSAAPVSAELNAFLVKAIDGSYYEYNSVDLNNSYVSYQMNSGSAGAKMYLHFDGLQKASGKVIGLKDTVKGYMDYPETALAFLMYQMWGKSFDINTYFATDSGVKLAEQVSNVKVVDKNGNVSGGGGETPGDQSYTLNASQKEFLVSSGSAKVQFTVSVPGGADNVLLIAAENNGVIDSLLDDGNYSTSGDDLPGDSIYSCMANVDLSQEKDYQYYAQVLKNGHAINAELVVVSVIMGLTDVETEGMAADQEEISTLLKSDAYESLSLQEKAAKVTELLNTFEETALLKTFDVGDIAEQPYAPIIKDSIYMDMDNNMVFYQFSSGVLAGVMLESIKKTEPPIDSSEIETSTQSEIDNEMDQDEQEPIIQREEIDTSAPVTKINSVTNTMDGISTNGTSNGKALILYGWEDKASLENGWVDKEDGFKKSSLYPYYEKAVKELNGKGLNTTIDNDVTVQELQEVLDDDYDVICISMHGSMLTTGALWWEKKYPVICTEEEVTKEKNKTYSADLDKKRIATITSGNSITEKVTTNYWVYPQFFDFHYDSDDLAGSFVYLDNCEGMGKSGEINNTLADSFTGRGAESVIGFHNSVYIGYGANLFFDMTDQLLKSTTAQESLNHAINKYGKTDEIWHKQCVADHPAAYPILKGDGSFKLVSADFENGGFENGGTLTGWNRIGDVRVLNKIGSLTPTEGKQMAFISTGIGSKESQYLEGTEGSILSQNILLPTTAKSISLQYDVLSEEPLEWIGSSFDDQFTAELIGSNGEVLKILSNESVNSSIWFLLEGINFDGGDNTTYHTGWKTASNTDISGYAGQNVTLRFRVWDKGDSKYDTAALIDGITFK